MVGRANRTEPVSSRLDILDRQVRRITELLDADRPLIEIVTTIHGARTTVAELGASLIDGCLDDQFEAISRTADTAQRRIRLDGLLDIMAHLPND